MSMYPLLFDFRADVAEHETHSICPVRITVDVQFAIWAGPFVRPKEPKAVRHNTIVLHDQQMAHENDARSRTSAVLPAL